MKVNQKKGFSNENPFFVQTFIVIMAKMMTKIMKMYNFRL